MDRRQFLRSAAAGSLSLAFGPAFWRNAYSAPASVGPGPYGSIANRAPDANGIILPEGFSSRVIATSGVALGASGYVWHTDPDGGAVFPAADGGWVYVSNCEERLDLVGGGAGAIRFDEHGEVVDAYRILDGTYTNCAGGPTPWGTWLSCEEHPLGQVWECDPFRPGQGVARPAMGRFWHEAVAVDEANGTLYLTEDNQKDGRFYRFTPTTYPDLSSGVLEAASEAADGSVTWVPVPLADTKPVDAVTMVALGATIYPGAEGVWVDSGLVYFTTKGDNRVTAFDIAAQRMEVLYDEADHGADPPLTGVDNIVVSRSGDLYVCEDGGNMEIGLLTPERELATFLRIVGQDDSEICGAAFDPSGSRLYFSSMRTVTGSIGGGGTTYEITGPFRDAPAAPVTTAMDALGALSTRS
jgi:secreted PhoX family phosphatase